MRILFTLVPAFASIRVAYVLRWPARVATFAGLLSALIGAVTVVAFATFSHFFGAEPGHSLAETIAHQVPTHVTLPIDEGVFVGILVDTSGRPGHRKVDAGEGIEWVAPGSRECMGDGAGFVSGYVRVKAAMPR